MESVFILVVAGLTSVGAYVFGIAGLGLSASRLWLALGKACECVGLTLVFSVVNLAVAMFADSCHAVAQRAIHLPLYRLRYHVSHAIMAPGADLSGLA